MGHRETTVKTSSFYIKKMHSILLGSFEYLLSATVKHFNTSVAQHFYPIKITTTSNAQPSEVVSSRPVSLFQEQLGQTLGRKSLKCPS